MINIAGKPRRFWNESRSHVAVDLGDETAVLVAWTADPDNNPEIAADPLFQLLWKEYQTKPESFAEPVPPQTELVSRLISDRQFFHGLWKWELIPEEEAFQAVQIGKMPTTLGQIVQGIPASKLPFKMTKRDVEFIIIGATTFDIEHPITQVIAVAFGWDRAQLETFWSFCEML
jgi:hypothetical protein